ncbi:MAG: hypothetical protein AB1750_11195 [Chloroflexota bacterium]
MESLLPWATVALLFLTSTGLLISRDWRWSLGLLAAQYAGAFLLITQHWPFGLAAVKLVTGWMTAAALGVTRLGLPEAENRAESAWPQGRLFRIFASAIVATLVAAAIPAFETLIPGISRPVVAGGALLFGMGLLHLGFTSETLRIVLGLLTLLAGFEVLYSTVETSILLTGLLAVINLGLALVGSYFMTAAHKEESA